MKKLILVAVLAVSVCSARAQTNTPAVDVALSNLMVQLGQLQSEVKAARSNANADATVQTITFSNGVPIATNSVAASTGSKLSAWSISAGSIVSEIGGLLAAIVVFARALRKIIPDASQVNDAGVLLATIGGEINPSKAKLAAAAVNPSAPVPSVPPTPIAAQPKV